MKKPLTAIAAAIISALLLFTAACGTANAQPYVTVTFETGTDETFPAVMRTVGATYGELPVPEKEEHSFAGWFTSRDYTERIYEISKVKSEDHTLYAKWKYDGAIADVSFDAAGGVPVPSAQYKAGKPFGELPAPERDDYLFEGWRIGGADGEPVTKDTVVPDKKKITLFALWTYNGTVTVELSCDKQNVPSFTRSVGEPYGILPALETENMRFVGWFDEDGLYGNKVNSDDSVPAVERITLYARWESNGEVDTAPSLLASGSNHVAAVDGDGKLRTWGKDSYCQLGLGGEYSLIKDRPYYASPVSIMTDKKFKAVAADGSLTYAIDEHGALYLWGKHNFGAIGDEKFSVLSEPTHILQSVSFAAISCSYAKTVAIDKQGNLVELEKSTQFSSEGTLSSKRYDIGKKFAAAQAGSTFALAIDVDGYMWGLGRNSDNVFCDDNVKISAVPVPVMKDKRFSALSVGYSHVLAIDFDGRLWTWGANRRGQCGVGDFNNHDSAHCIMPEKTFTRVFAGNTASMATDSDGKTWIFGAAYSGDGKSRIDAASPVEAPAVANIVEAAMSVNFTVVRAADGQLKSFGQNTSGQLGIGVSPDVKEPTLSLSDKSFKLVRIFDKCTYAIDSDGGLYFWGRDGDGNNRLPTRIFDKLEVSDISFGKDHTLVLCTDGTIAAWGGNAYGQLGDGTAKDSDSPVTVKTDADVRFTRICAGGNRSYAIDSTGRLWGWGENSRKTYKMSFGITTKSQTVTCNGRLGDGGIYDRTSPVPIAHDTLFTDISSGWCDSYEDDDIYVQTFAIDDRGGIWAWGDVGGSFWTGISNTFNVNGNAFSVVGCHKRVYYVPTALDVKITDPNIALQSAGDVAPQNESVRFASVTVGDLSLNFGRSRLSHDYDSNNSFAENVFAISTDGVLYVLYGRENDNGTYSTAAKRLESNVSRIFATSGGTSPLRPDYASALYTVRSDGQLRKTTGNTDRPLGSSGKFPYDWTTSYTSETVDCPIAASYLTVTGDSFGILDGDGKLYVWGNNSYGKLGFSTTEFLSPMPITFG